MEPYYHEQLADTQAEQDRLRKERELKDELRKQISNAFSVGNYNLSFVVTINEMTDNLYRDEFRPIPKKNIY